MKAQFCPSSLSCQDLFLLLSTVGVLCGAGKLGLHWGGAWVAVQEAGVAEGGGRVAVAVLCCLLHCRVACGEKGLHSEGDL